MPTLKDDAGTLDPTSVVKPDVKAQPDVAVALAKLEAIRVEKIRVAARVEAIPKPNPAVRRIKYIDAVNKYHATQRAIALSISEKLIEDIPVDTKSKLG
jgi:hypothetical protein